jgi:hypothetical protein
VAADAVDVPVAAGAVDVPVAAGAIADAAGLVGEDTNFFATDLHGFSRIS